MIKKETFVQAIRAIQLQEEETDQLNAIYRKMTGGMGYLSFNGVVHEALLQTLADAMDDQFQYIEWWLYEAPKDSKSVFWEEDGKVVSIDLAEPDALYDYLVQSVRERMVDVGNAGQESKTGGDIL